MKLRQPFLFNLSINSPFIFPFILALLTACVLPLAHAAESPEEIISAVDQIRNPSDSFLMKVDVTDPDGKDAPTLFEVSISGNDKTLVKTLEPARDRGRNLLMLNEDMWVYLPNLKRAVRIALSQKLTGQAANGDISRMRWSGDYSASIESQTPTEWTLLLAAKKKGLTYEKIRVAVSKKSHHPLHAEFLSLSGKPLKKATYSGYREMAGKVRPTEIRIQDAVRENERSVIRIQSMEVKKFPQSLFNQNSLN